MNLQFEFIDLFCGAGGTTTGVDRARFGNDKIARVIACINHDKNAIQSHLLNHQKTLHFTEDIKNFDVTRFPEWSNDSVKCLWASLECTNFSNAKGGQPRDADSRTLAEHLYRYIEHLQPDYIMIENVREFKAWGDLDENGKPLSRDKGRLYQRWIKKMESYGYKSDDRILDSADFGAYQSRKRLFIIFAKEGFPILFPQATHSKAVKSYKYQVESKKLKPWKAVKHVLDLQDEGESIFTRKKPLVEKTLERIYAGLVKFAKADEGFIVKYMGNNQKTGISMPKSLNDPLNVISTQARQQVVKLQKVFISKYFSSDKPGSMNTSIEGPAHTIKTKDNHSLITSDFLLKYHGTGKNVKDIECPCSTLSTKDRLAKVKAVHFLDEQFGSSKVGKSVNLPCSALTTTPKYNLVSSKYLMNPQYSNKGASLEKPCFTLIAKMDKRPPYLVSTESGDDYAILIYESDSPAMKKIKEFMAENGIIDIKMRLLKIPELIKIQGFPWNYKLIGTQTEQKKYIGNAVVPVMAKKLVEALYKPVQEYLKLKRAA
jgi:DNA (cytosine-5)-methyltransferase 1